MRAGGELEYVPRYLEAYFLDSRIPDSKIACLEKTNQELRDRLAESQQTHRERDNLIQSLRAHEESSSMSPAISMYISLIHVC